MADIMIMFLDYTGLPRAFAYGPASKRPEIEERARRELGIYCAKKHGLGDLDLADPSRFTMQARAMDTCPYCGERPLQLNGCSVGVTCGASECQEANYRANAARSK